MKNWNELNIWYWRVLNKRIGEYWIYDTLIGYTIQILWKSKLRWSMERCYKEKVGEIHKRVVWNAYCSGCNMRMFLQEVIWSNLCILLEHS